MTFYRLGAVVFIGAAVLAGQAFAQDAASQNAASKATDAEGMGQAIGEAASGGQSVFVTATAHEALSTAVAGADAVDPAVWDRVGQGAVTQAMHEAEVLAKAAGRDVGDAEQITMLSKTVQGNAAVMTVSVRYLLK